MSYSKSNKPTKSTKSSTTTNPKAGRHSTSETVLNRVPLSPKSIAKTLEQQIQCPICYHTMLEQIMMCSNGHSLCNDCFQRLNDPKICPSCKQRYVSYVDWAQFTCHDVVWCSCSELVVSDLAVLKLNVFCRFSCHGLMHHLLSKLVSS